MAEAQKWPVLGAERLEWASRYDGQFSAFSGPSTYSAAVVPVIASRTPQLTARVTELSRAAEHELIRFDAGLGDELVGLAPLLLRSESAASSQIENLTASARSILTAEIGDTGRRNATEIVSSTRAMRSALELADDLTPEAVREMHRVLMSATNHTPGEWRSEPVWIGADARSPVGATYVAPRHEYVPALMDDVMAFAARQDLPVLAQVAIAHAQFETIHPFTDGNGRTGRALVQSMLRAKGLTRDVVVPISAGLLVDVAAYHDALTSYRAGDVEPIVEQFARAAVDAIINARQLVDALRVVRQSWSEILNARSGSQLAKLLPFVVQRPVFTASEAAAYLDIAPSNAYPLIKRLVALGIAQQKSEHGLGVVVYRSDDVLNLLDQFAERAGRRSV